MKKATMTGEQLISVMPHCPTSKAGQYARLLTEAMFEAEINTPIRQASFLGQLAVESGDLRWFEEFGDGSAYEWRSDLGNIQRGDGKKYKGRGPIQLTGRRNYRAAGAVLGIDLEMRPEQAADPEVGFRVAAWYWSSRKLNDAADKLDHRGVTRAINGGLTHHEQRLDSSYRALEVLISSM